MRFLLEQVASYHLILLVGTFGKMKTHSTQHTIYSIILKKAYNIKYKICICGFHLDGEKSRHNIQWFQPSPLGSRFTCLDVLI